jgi:hypothetical protein
LLNQCLEGESRVQGTGSRDGKQEEANMKKFFVISLHLLFSSFGLLEYCFSRGIRKLRYNLGYHYVSRIQYAHPASMNISVSIKENSQEPYLKSYMLCENPVTRIPQYITWTISLN